MNNNDQPVQNIIDIWPKLSQLFANILKIRLYRQTDNEVIERKNVDFSYSMLDGTTRGRNAAVGEALSSS